jgi:hypothetical protein
METWVGDGAKSDKTRRRVFGLDGRDELDRLGLHIIRIVQNTAIGSRARPRCRKEIVIAPTMQDALHASSSCVRKTYESTDKVNFGNLLTKGHFGMVAIWVFEEELSDVSWHW